MRDAKNLLTMDGMAYVASVPEGEIITGIVTAGNELFVSTNKHIYLLVDRKRLEIVE